MPAPKSPTPTPADLAPHDGAAGETAGMAALQSENARLRAKIDELQGAGAAAPNTAPVRTKPSFGMSEGEREELARLGKTTSPFDGTRYLAEGSETVDGVLQPTGVREVEQDEFDKRLPWGETGAPRDTTKADRTPVATN